MSWMMLTWLKIGWFWQNKMLSGQFLFSVNVGHFTMPLNYLPLGIDKNVVFKYIFNCKYSYHIGEHSDQTYASLLFVVTSQSIDFLLGNFQSWLWWLLLVLEWDGFGKIEWRKFQTFMDQRGGGLVVDNISSQSSFSRDPWYGLPFDRII